MNDRTALLPWLAEPLARGLGLRSHALLLHGPGGVGQFELGVALATGWLCEAQDSTMARPCGHCGSCHLMAMHSHPDFHLLVPAALREPLGWGAATDGDEPAKAGVAGKSAAKPSKEIRVDAVRAATDWGQKTASRGRAKIILIHPAQAMNAVTANALLKTLEEPPGRLRLLLTAHDPEALLPTVRSRCQRLPLPLPPTSQALSWLTGQGLERPETLLAGAGGQPLEALAIAADGIDAAAWEQLPSAVRHGRPAPLASWPLVRLIDALQKLCHDLMCHRASGLPRYFSQAALAPALRPSAPEWPALAQWSRELLAAARHDEHPWHAALRIEALVEQGARLWQTPRKTAFAGSGALDTLDAR
jgi:DNA polymerase-3 subunit delta'